MTEAAPTLILYPVFAMFLLVTVVLLRMRSMRFAAVRKKEVSAVYYRAYQDGAEPDPPGDLLAGCVCVGLRRLAIRAHLRASHLEQRGRPIQRLLRERVCSPRDVVQSSGTTRPGGVARRADRRGFALVQGRHTRNKGMKERIRGWRVPARTCHSRAAALISLRTVAA